MESTLTKNQTLTFGPKHYTEGGRKYTITTMVRHDDHCGNGHNTFSITGRINELKGGRTYEHSCGCIHDEIRKHPELAGLIKWHGCSTDGPMHYVENTIYHAGDRDYNGLKAGEFRQYSPGPGSGIPQWELNVPDSLTVYAHEKPAPVTLEWKPCGRMGEGKARQLDAARNAAIWPEATDAELCQEPEQLKAALLARLPELMARFKVAVESLGLVY